MSGGGGNVLKVAAPLALGLMLPGIGTAIAGGLGTMGMGTTAAGYLGSALAGAGTGALGSALTGGNVGKGALLGGIGGGIGQGLQNNFPSTFGVSGSTAAQAADPNFAYSTGSGLNAADTAHISNMFKAGTPSITGVSSVAAPAASTGGISGLLDSKYAMPLGAGALSLLASGEEQPQLTGGRNDAPVRTVLATNRTGQPVDPSVYYGSGGSRDYFDQQNPDVVYAAEGGAITQASKYNRSETPQPSQSKQIAEGIAALAPALAANENTVAASQPLQRTFQPIDPSVYYGVGGMRDYFAPVAPTAQDNSPTGVSSVPLPKFKKGGGIGHLIQGAGDGTSDDIPAMLSDGEYVIPSAVVSALGNGSNKAGAKKLDGFKKNVLKTHYKSAKAPKAKGIGSYMQGMAA